MKRILISLLSVLVMISSVFWFLENRKSNRTSQQNQSEKLHIVTTNSILEDMVKTVGQDRIDLYSIVKRGTDPHEYEPQPSDIAKTTEANLVFYNGLNLETGGNGWFTKLVETSHKVFNQDVFSASESVTPQQLTTDENEVDPHAWLNLENGIIYVQNIAKVMSEKDPKNAEFYQENATNYCQKLLQLHQSAKEKFATIPQNQRLLVTSEGAFKYFANAYQVTPVYIWEINTESQGTPEQMTTVLAKIKAANVKSLFLESSVSPKAMEQVAKETGLPIYSTLFTDSLAKAGNPGDTYYSMMDWNITKIIEGMTK
ncbi:metal ABC transporter solute-binding protein, Zn/Mn family [Holzapfeliella sp. JNUCC 72]